KNNKKDVVNPSSTYSSTPTTKTSKSTTSASSTTYSSTPVTMISKSITSTTSKDSKIPTPSSPNTTTKSYSPSSPVISKVTTEESSKLPTSPSSSNKTISFSAPTSTTKSTKSKSKKVIQPQGHTKTTIKKTNNDDNNKLAKDFLFFLQLPKLQFRTSDGLWDRGWAQRKEYFRPFAGRAYVYAIVGPFNINTATYTELMTIDDIGVPEKVLERLKFLE
ncbi:19261_t:CDS:2, partial [Entrophospora sp. SA101]